MNKEGFWGGMVQAGKVEAQRSEQKDKKRGATHQGNQQSSSVGVGPGQDGSFGAAIAEMNLAAAWEQRAAGRGGLIEREQQQEQET